MQRQIFIRSMTVGDRRSDRDRIQSFDRIREQSALQSRMDCFNLQILPK